MASTNHSGFHLQSLIGGSTNLKQKYGYPQISGETDTEPEWHVVWNNLNATVVFTSAIAVGQACAESPEERASRILRTTSPYPRRSFFIDPFYSIFTFNRFP